MLGLLSLPSQGKSCRTRFSDIPDNLSSRRLVAINVAAEIAGERDDVRGPSTFRAALIDECYRLTPEVLLARARFRLV